MCPPYLLFFPENRKRSGSAISKEQSISKQEKMLQSLRKCRLCILFHSIQLFYIALFQTFIVNLRTFFQVIILCFTSKHIILIIYARSCYRALLYFHI